MQVRVGAGGAVRGAGLQGGGAGEVVGQGGVPLLTRGLLGVQRHFGTLDDDVVDLKLLPSAGRGEEV